MRKGRRGPYSSAGSVRSYGSYNSYSSSKRSTGGYSNASSSKPKSNYSYNSYNYGRNLRRWFPQISLFNNQYSYIFDLLAYKFLCWSFLSPIYE